MSFQPYGRQKIERLQRAPRLDRMGTMHPNKAGHRNYRDQLVPALQRNLYILGSLDDPRPPQP